MLRKGFNDPEPCFFVCPYGPVVILVGIEKDSFRGLLLFAGTPSNPLSCAIPDILPLK